MNKFNYLDQLIANCEEAKKAFPSREITIDNIADIEKVKDFKSAIYIIRSVHDKFHRTLILSGFCFLKIAKISL
ncbi:hypothetical protein KTI02_13725, partial [Acinetobacter pittii]|nr:hypothetical protein [Acinetobacter pittii]